MHGKGMPSLHGGGRGDEFVKVGVEIPKHVIGEEKKLWEKLSKEDAKEKKGKGFFGLF
jgi:DnaJ-class molecular chaperone